MSRFIVLMITLDGDKIPGQAWNDERGCSAFMRDVWAHFPRGERPHLARRRGEIIDEIGEVFGPARCCFYKSIVLNKIMLIFAEKINLPVDYGI